MIDNVLKQNGLVVAYHTFAMHMFNVHNSMALTSTGKRNTFKKLTEESRFRWLEWEFRLDSETVNFIMDEVLADIKEVGLREMLNRANWMLNASTKVMKHDNQLLGISANRK